MKFKVLLGIALAATLAAGSGCTNSSGTSESPVFVTVSIDLQPGFVNVATPTAVQINTITLQSKRKNADSVDTLGFSDVEINNYTVTFRRTDGGTQVPPMQSFGGAGLLPHDGTLTLSNFPIMYGSSVQGPPMDQLLPFNGGIDSETGKDEIDMAFDLIFYGTTVSGKRVQSQTASGILIFRYVAVTQSSRQAK